MNKGRRIRSVNVEIPLPEAMIHHIQSFMSGKEAAQTALISKSWYNAWLTRPALDFDDLYFQEQSSPFPPFGVKFKEFARKTMQRYRDLSLKIDSFRLSVCRVYYKRTYYADALIVNAMKTGATDVHLEFPFAFTVPQEVLGSQTLLKLSLKGCEVDGNSLISCSTLKSLTLDNVIFTSEDVFGNIISSCSTSIEELSLSSPFGLSLSRMNLYELHKLRRLFLCSVNVGNMFSSNFFCRFPYLKDLSIIDCRGCKVIEIASVSLRTISFTPQSGSWRAKFCVPNIQKFTYSGFCLPSQLSITLAMGSSEWDFDISIWCNQFYKKSWFLNLKKCMSKFRLSRISLSIHLGRRLRGNTEHEVEVEVTPKPLVLENLTIDATSSYCCALLVRLFGICRPKFATHYEEYNDAPLDILCKRQSMFGQFGLKEVKVELLSKPLDASKTRTNALPTRRAQLIWEDF